MKTALVTGSAGFIGMHIAKRWLDMVTASGGFARGIDAGHWLQERRAEETHRALHGSRRDAKPVEPAGEHDEVDALDGPQHGDEAAEDADDCA